MFANFSKTRKNWRFPPHRPWGPFSLVSHLCPDFIQMSEFLYLRCPDVKLWWFSSFSQTFRKIEKIEDFPHPGAGDPLRSFHTCAQISSKWVNFYILVVLMSNYDDFFIFANFSKTRKNWRFPPPRPWGPFSHVSHLCPDFIQMSEFLYLSCPDVKLWWFSSFSQTFWKLEKIEDFPHKGRPFSLISHLCPDFIQMSEFLYLSCPDVKLWWFSSFSQTFRKIEKIGRFPQPRNWGPFSLISHLCPDFIQISKFLYLSCPDVKLWWFLHFCKLFENSKKLKISPTPALGTLFACFTLVPRFHPNEWIFIS